MMRNSNGWKKGLPAAGGVVVGVLLSASLAGGTGSESSQLQDPAITRLQQELINLRLAITTKTDTMQIEFDRFERELNQLRHRLESVEQQQRGLASPLTAGRPRPGVEGGKVVAAEAFFLRDSEGEIRAQLAMNDFGPSLSLANAEGVVTAELVSTAGGAELWLRDADGDIRALIAAAEEKGGLVLFDANGNPLFRRD